MPYAPGGTVDVFARVFAPRLEAKLGKPIVVENVAGAGGMIGVGRIAKAAPDGYTIGLGIVSDVVIAPLTESAATYTGKLSPVGVMSKERDIGNPDMGSAGETPELKGMDFYFWTGLFAAKGTPAPIVATLNAAFQETLREPAIAARFKDMGVKIIGPMKPAEFGSFVASSNDAWAAVAKQSIRK